MEPQAGSYTEVVLSHEGYHESCRTIVFLFRIPLILQMLICRAPYKGPPPPPVGLQTLSSKLWQLYLEAQQNRKDTADKKRQALLIVTTVPEELQKMRVLGSFPKAQTLWPEAGLGSYSNFGRLKCYSQVHGQSVGVFGLGFGFYGRFRRAGHMVRLWVLGSCM